MGPNSAPSCATPHIPGVGLSSLPIKTDIEVASTLLWVSDWKIINASTYYPVQRSKNFMHGLSLMSTNNDFTSHWINQNERRWFNTATSKRVFISSYSWATSRPSNSFLTSHWMRSATMFNLSWLLIIAILHPRHSQEAYHANIHVSSDKLFFPFSIIGIGLQNTLKK